MTTKQESKLLNSRYLMLSVINLIISISFSMVYTSIQKYEMGLGIATAVAGLITGAFNIASMAIRPFSGLISDRINRKLLLIIATFGMGLSIFGYLFITDPTALIVLRCLHGIFFALSTTVNMAIIPGIVPSKQVGEAICYFGLSQSIAMAVGPSLGLWLIKVGGYTLSFGIAAALCIAGGCVAIPTHLTEQNTMTAPRHTLKLSDIIVPRCLPFTMIEVAIAAVSGLESAYIVLYAASVGIENIGWYFTISAGTVIFCRVFLGKLIDQKGTFAVFPGLTLMIVGLLVLWLQQGAWMFAVAAVLKTIGVNLSKPALQAAAIKSVGNERRGAAVSTYYIGTDLGQGLSPMVAGQIIDGNGGNYRILFLLFTLPLALAGTLFAMLNRWMKKRRTNTGVSKK